MASNRLWGYGSFFSDTVSKTTTVVAKIYSSSTMVQLKEGVSKCLQSGQESLEKAKSAVEQAMYSENVKSMSKTIQQGAKESYNKAASLAIHYLSDDKIVEPCKEFKNSISLHYDIAQKKWEEFLKSEKVLRLKSMYDGSIDSILSANLLFDFGLLFVPGGSTICLTLKYSKYIVAACIFLLSSLKSYQIRKQDQNIHDKIDPYQKNIDEAYKTMSELNSIFLDIENTLKKLDLNEKTYIHAKDFEVKSYAERKDDIHSAHDKINVLKSILEGGEKSAWLFYLLQFACFYAPKNNTFTFFKIMLFMSILLATAFSSVQKNRLKTNNEEQLKDIQEQLNPILTAIHQLQEKLDQNTQSIFHQLPPISSQDPSTWESLTNLLKSITDSSSKASGMYLLLQGILPGYPSMEFTLCACIMVISGIDSYIELSKQERVKHSFDELEFNMSYLNEMTERMKLLLDNQKEYEKQLNELQQFKNEFMQRQGNFLFFTDKPEPSSMVKTPEAKSQSLTG